MDEVVLQQAIMNVMKNDAFVHIIRGQMREQVVAAVSEAVAAKDAEIESLTEELTGLPRAVREAPLPGRVRDS